MVFPEWFLCETLWKKLTPEFPQGATILATGLSCALQWGHWSWLEQLCLTWDSPCFSSSRLSPQPPTNSFLCKHNTSKKSTCFQKESKQEQKLQKNQKTIYYHYHKEYKNRTIHVYQYQQTVSWIKNCQNSWAQSTVVSGSKSSCRSVTSRVPWGQYCGRPYLMPLWMIWMMRRVHPK